MDEELSEHPRPWIQGDLAPNQIYDDDDRFVAQCVSFEAAALIVRRVNESEG